MKLFCIPYAGGSEVIYYKWKRYLNSSIYLEPIELKGRGKRFNEDFYENLEEAVEDILGNIKDNILYDEYAIYGHSMGSLLAYELYYKINKENLRLPKHIFFSGYKPPSIPRKERQIYLLPDDEFIKEVIELGGTPQEVEESKEMLQLFTPILRSDFKMLDKYIYKKKKDKIKCDISVLYGKEDDITLEDLLEWKNHGDKGFKVYNFEGNHFFINTNVENITKIINTVLAN
ncbi:thioesterase II family protein [Clostridium beijerinckii]|uniref:thioesterase II family protein n=1 Tax=Clostridium beijerinckii TaxID=1520 RepID=UPI00098C5934|nr:thioesterase domain-containing protein [Clostridium beijerinckii]MBA8934346.1 surfactin synthase thioesterase subunit [Clostridium beijerinckii]NRT35769.1 surfactin synthase thioesterase subunit [Clostridium beijerinckii]NRT44804.1 surfactin synthase thioesterase subunit [Clostridium beijerinckii]NRU38533.1 surfactin synthase thioesterase subunit [Clostridium beijerinckii]NRZ21203.1 surfactin synthase thioesterase subunit [Clostridium beijerinckii]